MADAAESPVPGLWKNMSKALSCDSAAAAQARGMRRGRTVLGPPVGWSAIVIATYGGCLRVAPWHRRRWMSALAPRAGRLPEGVDGSPRYVETSGIGSGVVP